MMKKTIAHIFTLCIISALPITPVKAQHAHKNDAPKQDIETIGIYNAGHPKSLGSGIYHNASRSGLSSALKNITLGHWISLERKINNFLLTDANTSSLRNDIKRQDSNNLFTLRLKALLKRGMNKEAFELYTKVSDTAQHEQLVRLGIYSMLLNQEKALACLEIKARFTDFQDIAIWHELNGYCSSTLSMNDETTKNIEIKSPVIKNIISSPDYLFEYNPETFKGLAPIEKALLTAEDRITWPQSNNITTFPSRDIQPLLLQTKIDENTKTFLSLYAIKNAIITPDDITEKYESLHKHYENKAPSAKNTLAKLVHIHKEADSTWSDKKRKQELEKAIKLSAQYGVTSLVPFTHALKKTDIGEDIAIKDMRTILSAFLYADTPSPKGWIKDIQNLLEKEENEQKKQALQKWLLLSLLLSDLVYEKDFSFKNYDFSAYFSTNSYTRDIKNIIENIDSRQNNGDKLRYVYNSGFDLLSNNSYKMPSFVLINALEQSGQNQNIGATLLLSSLILSNIAPNELYSGTLGDVVIAMNKIGFKDVSYRILAQAILEKDD